MKPERPVSILVLAILSVVWGAVGLVGSLCALGGAFASPYLMAFSAQGAGAPTPPPQMSNLLVGHFVASRGLGFVLAVVTVVAGLGLFGTHPWARRWSLVVAAVNLVAIPADRGMQHWVLASHKQKYMEDIVAWQASGPTPLPPPARAGQQLGATGGVVLFHAAAALGVAFSIAQLIVLRRPSVRAAFQRRGESSAAGG
jgi:hypothetical protein